MSQCKSNTNSGSQCTRNSIPFGRYCWQHTEAKVLKVSLVMAILTIIGFAADSLSLFDASVSYGEKKGWIEGDIVCDRNVDNGCYLDFKVENFTSDGSLFVDRSDGAMVFKHYEKGETNPFKSSGGLSLSILSGGGISVHSGIEKSNEDRYSLALSGPNTIYTVSYNDNKLNFYGEIKDLETEETLGWFTGNEFGINKPCAFSWNKDENGIEIIDGQGRVCFYVGALDKNEYIKRNPQTSPLAKLAIYAAKGKFVEFKGFFKHEDTYYIYNDKLIKTKKLNEAKQLIAEIKRQFVHYGKNSLGKRINKEK